MTEIEKIQYAKNFVDMMAKGINPLDGTTIPECDLLNNIRISRCMFFVSDILRQVIENDGIVSDKKNDNTPFSITSEQLAKYDYGTSPVSATEITRKIYSLVDNRDIKKITYKPLTSWLISVGMLCEKKNDEGKLRKYPTPEGEKIGITFERRTSYNGEYDVILYNKDAQKFIIDNIDAIIAKMN